MGPSTRTPSTRRWTASRCCSRRTDGHSARIELLQGPNNNKQVIELYTAATGPSSACSGNVVRIVNTAPVEFPMTAGVVPHSINNEMSSGAVLGGDVVIGGDIGWYRNHVALHCLPSAQGGGAARGKRWQ